MSLIGLMAALLMTQQALPAPPPHAQWQLTFAEEFDGEALDTEVWQSQASIRGGDRLEGRWPENNVVQDGILCQLTKLEDPPREGKNWSTAHIWTREFAQKYGYFEARMKYGRYLNNAFWLWRPGGQFPRPHFEIDINEGHTPREVTMNYHQYFYLEGDPKGDLFSTGKAWYAPEDLDDEFHLYAVEWDAEHIIWYVDGQITRVLKNPGAHGEADIRLSTVIMPRQLEKDGEALGTMEGVAMQVDWVRAYRKTEDLHALKLPEADVLKLPELKPGTARVPQEGPRAVVWEENFEGAAVGQLPAAWEIGDGQPGAVARQEADAGQALALDPGEYAFRMFGEALTGRIEVELDCLNPIRDPGLLFVTLGKFDSADAERRKTSYYTGDIGPYIHWYHRGLLAFYTEQDKWTYLARTRRGAWEHVRILLDIDDGVFDCYGGDKGDVFLGSGQFRHRQQASLGIGLRNRGDAGTVRVDNVSVRVVAGQ